MSFEETAKALRPQIVYKNLVLEGGGVLGLSYCGALEELHKRGLLGSITRFAGTSAGSIVAGLLSVGTPFNTISTVLTSLDPETMFDYGYKVAIPFNLMWHMGACKGDAFEKWYEGVLESLTGQSGITLAEVTEKYGTEVTIVTTSLNQRKAIYLNKDTYPDMTLAKAVRCSMSIEGVFQPVKVGGDLFVDGGTLNNYPIEVYHTIVDGEYVVNEETLGLMLMTEEELTDRFPPVTGLVSYFNSVMDCLISRVQKEYLDPADWDRTVKINCGAIQAFDFGIDEKQRTDLVERGRRAVIEHFGGPRVSQHEFNRRKKSVRC
jgi:NTE family protein